MAENTQSIIHVVDENLQSGFAQVPRPVLKAKGLSVKAKLVYAILLDYAWKDDHCFPGQDVLAYDLDISTDSVQRALVELKRLKLVDWKQQGLNKPNIYFVLRLSDNPYWTLDRTGNRILRFQETADSGYQETANSGTNNTQILDPKKNTPSNIRKSTRSNNKNGNNSASESTGLEGQNGDSAEGAVRVFHGVEGVAEIIKRKQGRPRKYTDDVSQTLLNYVADFQREFSDKATLSQSSSRIINLYERWGRGDLNAFVGALYQARSTTKEHSAAIHGSKFAYFCAIVEDLLGLREDHVNANLPN